MAKESFEEMMARLKSKIAETKGAKPAIEEKKVEEKKTEPPKVEEPKKEEPKSEPVKAEPAKVEPAKDATTPAEVAAVCETTLKEELKESVAPKTRKKKETEPISTPLTTTTTVPSGMSSASSASFSGSIESAISGAIANGISSALIRAKPSRMTVRRTFKKSGELVKEDGGDIETMDVPSFNGPTAQVSIALGHTINLGDYESCKVDIFMSTPCYLGEEDRAIEYVKNFVSNQLSKEVVSIREAAKSRK